MTETKWTPGEWTLYDGLAGGWIESLHETIHGNIVCEAPDKEENPASAAYWKANARLIAQAPALYEALEELLADFIGHHPDNGDRFCKRCHAICDPDDRIPFAHREFFPCYRASAVLAAVRGLE